jgi:hypothetical protein
VTNDGWFGRYAGRTRNLFQAGSEGHQPARLPSQALRHLIGMVIAFTWVNRLIAFRTELLLPLSQAMTPKPSPA